MSIIKSVRHHRAAPEWSVTASGGCNTLTEILFSCSLSSMSRLDRAGAKSRGKCDGGSQFYTGMGTRRRYLHNGCQIREKRRPEGHRQAGVSSGLCGREMGNKRDTGVASPNTHTLPWNHNHRYVPNGI